MLRMTPTSSAISELSEFLWNWLSTALAWALFTMTVYIPGAILSPSGAVDGVATSSPLSVLTSSCFFVSGTLPFLRLLYVFTSTYTGPLIACHFLCAVSIWAWSLGMLHLPQTCPSSPQFQQTTKLTQLWWFASHLPAVQREWYAPTALDRIILIWVKVSPSDSSSISNPIAQAFCKRKSNNFVNSGTE